MDLSKISVDVVRIMQQIRDKRKPGNGRQRDRDPDAPLKRFEFVKHITAGVLGCRETPQAPEEPNDTGRAVESPSEQSEVLSKVPS